MEGRRAGDSVQISRVVSVAVVLVLCWVPIAHGSTVGVLDEPDAIAVALAGPDAVVLRQDDRTFSLLAVPRVGGRAQMRERFPASVALTADGRFVLASDEGMPPQASRRGPSPRARRWVAAVGVHPWWGPR